MRTMDVSALWLQDLSLEPWLAVVDTLGNNSERRSRAVRAEEECLRLIYKSTSYLRPHCSETAIG